MKKFIFALATLLVMAVSARAMSYEQARQQALFLTDKMAYELNLTDSQYEAAYEINLDYLMGVNAVDDLYGPYWTQRNLDLSYILLSWQYRAFCDAAYFYRPLYWDAGYWHFGIYARYPHRDYFFFGRPAFFAEYRGGHSWHMNGGHSWYRGRDMRPNPGNGGKHFGMRDGFSRGDFGNGFRGNPNSSTSFGTAQRAPMMGGNNGGQQMGGQRQNGNMQFGNANRMNGQQRGNNNTFGSRESSTRNTVGNQRQGMNSTFGSSRYGNTPRNTFTPNRNNGSSSDNSSTGTRQSAPRSGEQMGFGSRRQSSSSNYGFGSSSSSSRSNSSFGSSRGSFGSGRSSMGTGRSSMGSGSSSIGSGSRPSMSTSRGGGNMGGGASFGGGRSGGSSAGHAGGGGGSFGSRR